jgi:EspG family
VATQTVARLELTGPEWLVLCQAADITAPDGLEPPAEVSEEELAEARQALVDKELLTEEEGDGEGPEVRIHSWTAAHVLVWTAPDALVRVEVSMGDVGLRGVYAVQGPLGVSLFTLPDGGVELSMFETMDLGAELQRCVPEIPPELSERSTMSRLVPDTAEAPIEGRVPLAALADSSVPGFTPGADGVSVTEEEAEIAAALTARTVGVLNCLVLGGGRDGRPVLGATVVWFATDAGWVGMDPHPDGSGRKLVDLIPVDREAISGWLAPYLARVLEAASG